MIDLAIEIYWARKKRTAVTIPEPPAPPPPANRHLELLPKVTPLDETRAALNALVAKGVPKTTITES